jgi:asparagine synthase (glutamine-hydrolysing)
VLGRLPDRFTFKSVTHKLRWADLMASKVGAERYAESLQYFWFNGAQRARLYTNRFRTDVADRRADASVLAHYEAPNATDPIDKMMYVDSATRLPEQSLMILDRTSMAYSLESRSPFLDPRLAEFMARVPVSLKIKGRKLRYLERRLAEKYLPPELLRRPKQGFASPLMYVMDTELRQLGGSMLRQSALVQDGYLQAERVQGLLDEHLGRKRDHGNRLWLLLSAEAWYRQFIAEGEAPGGERASAIAGAVAD